MTMKSPVFVDCYGHLADRFDESMRKVVPGLDVFQGSADSDDVLIHRLKGRRHALVYMGYLSRRVLKACPDLQTVAYLSSGLATHVDMDAIQETNVRLEGVKGYGDRAVAEHAIALALGGLKRLAEMDRCVRQGRFELMLTEEFSGKTFGIIGLGGIGCETARIAHALGANVVGWNRSGSPPEDDIPVRILPMNGALEQSDILSIHLALNGQTEGILDQASFGRMKSNVILVNTARAGLVDEKALMEALRSRKIGHAALDVFHDEPLPIGHPITSFDNVTLSPHSAWMTTQAIDRLLIAGLNLLKRQIAETS